MSAPRGMIASTTNVLIASVVPQPISSANVIGMSPINVSEDEVERSEDRDDIGNVDAAQQPRQDRDVAEARGADLHPERTGRALGHEVVAHLTERVLGLDPDLALRHLDD